MALSKSAKGKYATRKSTEHFILGQPAELPAYLLPTRKSFINYFRKRKGEIDPETGRPLTEKQALQLACDKVWLFGQRKEYLVSPCLG